MIRIASLALISTLAGLALVACSDNDGQYATNPPTFHVDGSTASWYDGQVVQLDYTQPFQCKNPPTAQSASGCEVGAQAVTPPDTGSIPILWVLVPLFSPAPDSNTLQCPHSGMCVDHPSGLDLSTYLSSVFGAGAGKTPLPPHSHIITDIDQHVNDPWLVTVVGVLNDSSWNSIVEGQSLSRVRGLQATDGVSTANPWARTSQQTFRPICSSSSRYTDDCAVGIRRSW